MQTLPMLCRERGFSLDGLRAFVRSRPELRRMGTAIGPSTAYSVEEVAAIVAAWEARKTAKATAEKVTA